MAITGASVTHKRDTKWPPLNAGLKVNGSFVNSQTALVRFESTRQGPGKVSGSNPGVFKPRAQISSKALNPTLLRGRVGGLSPA